MVKETLLRPKRMVAELWMPNPLLELADGGVLVLSVSGRESHIFESSRLVASEGMSDLFRYLNVRVNKSHGCCMSVQKLKFGIIYF